MKIGLLICTYNRPQYLKLCFESLQRADLSKIFEVFIVDDCSTDKLVEKLIVDFVVNDKNRSVFYKPENLSIKDSLLYGFNRLFGLGCDTVINLDGDAIVRNDFVDRLLELHEKYPLLIKTGFNCNTLNRDGSIRHQHLYSEPGATFRQSVGGINMCFGRETYLRFVKPALIQTLTYGGNWDTWACINCKNESLPIAVTVPSVIQHLGVQSSMGHDAGGEPADTADDFKPLGLINVTLLGVADDFKGLWKAADISCQNIHFGAVKILSEGSPAQIRKLGSKIEYSKFIFNELLEHIETDYFLLIQADGFVLNWKAWTTEFLKYDYIGAVWNWYDDGMQVGNGGFSLRSKRLHEALKFVQLQNDHIIKNYEEDHNICRIHRKYLEEFHDIKFAPPLLADRFSIEGWRDDKIYHGSFGFHGWSIDFSNSNLPYVPYLIPNSRKIF
jgi:glycosyltransferase involved in cell wall biosynthesis